mgnify:CR=1 FL=1
MGSDSVAASDDSSCTEAAPTGTKTCAATAACIPDRWDATEFEECPVHCGAAETTLARTVDCMGSNGNTASDPVSCTAAKPEVSKICGATAACVEYNWSAAEFAECPSDCGLSETTLTRIVDCYGSDGNAAVAQFCQEAKPAETKTCPATTPCVTYAFVAPGFEACPGDCPDGLSCPATYKCGLAASTLTRSVACTGSDGNAAADAATHTHARAHTDTYTHTPSICYTPA